MSDKLVAIGYSFDTMEEAQSYLAATGRTDATVEDLNKRGIPRVYVSVPPDAEPLPKPSEVK